MKKVFVLAFSLFVFSACKAHDESHDKSPDSSNTKSLYSKWQSERDGTTLLDLSSCEVLAEDGVCTIGTDVTPQRAELRKDSSYVITFKEDSKGANSGRLTVIEHLSSSDDYVVEFSGRYKVSGGTLRICATQFTSTECADYRYADYS